MDDIRTGPSNQPNPTGATPATGDTPLRAHDTPRTRQPLTPWNDGKTVLGGYRVVHSLGQGGYALVYHLLAPVSGASFAAKRALFLDDKNRRAFLREMLTWADLPDHPHILPFRFFRSEGDEIILFTDYAGGGSLHDWIRKGKLTSDEQRVDLAIQFAWGLHAAHEWGLVHQDVKPSNALLTADGRVMVGDFGLARSRGFLAETSAHISHNVQVTVAGSTPAYCSPEQAEGKRLDRRTDIWSWAITVLEMFTGSHPQNGTLAPELLHQSKSHLPPAIVDILLRCLQRNPDDRCPNLLEVAEALSKLQSNSRATPSFSRPGPMIPHDRRLQEGASWGDPLPWLHEALTLADRSAAEAEALLPPPAHSRRAQAIADLIVYDEAARFLEIAIAAGHPESRERCAMLHGYSKAFVHEHLGDLPGALPLYDRAIALLEQLVEQGRTELANDLAAACMNKANALQSLGEGRLNKANALQSLGEERSALPLYDRAIALLEQLVEQGRTELANDLAGACMNKAVALKSLGEGRSALPLYDRAIALLEQLVKQGRTELAHDLAKACMNKAVAVGDLGDERSALPLYDRAIAIREQLVEQGRTELRGDLAWVRLTLVATRLQLGVGQEEIQELVLAEMAALQQEMERTGRSDLQRVFAWAERTFAGLLTKE